MTIDNIDVSETLAKAKSLLEANKNISPEFKSTVELLILVITLLVNRLSTNSNNSSKPPSQDPNRQRGSKQKKDDARKPGGQIGHKGQTLEKVKNPDEVKTIKIDKRKLPKGPYKEVGYETRQVIDMRISRHVIEYRAQILEDTKGNRFTAEFPEDVTKPVQYGEGLKAHSVYMSQFQLLPYERIQDYFTDQLGIPVSPGSLFNFNKEAFDRLAAFESIAKSNLIRSLLLHADETGINVNGKRLWLHCASNGLWTLFYPHDKRGKDAMDEMGVLPHFHGTLCHDHWKAYFQFKCLHALCNAHHLRELEFAYEEDKQKWAKKMRELLLEIKKAVDDAVGSLPQKDQKAFLKRYRNILKKADRECPAQDESQRIKGSRGKLKQTKSRNLLERLRDYEVETLRFMSDKNVPFTNNQGENDIRMTKVQQKISGCFRSMEGAKIFCRIRSYLSTSRKQGTQPTEALRLLFSGTLPESCSKFRSD